MDDHLCFPVLLDGATGSNLLAAGMPTGVCTEAWILENPQALISLQQKYVEAGSDAILAPTFGANRAALAPFGLDGQTSDINRRLVALSRKAAGDRVRVAGNISPMGLEYNPQKAYTGKEILEIYREQAMALKLAGVDFLFAEAFMSLSHMKAVLTAAKEADLDAYLCLTVDEEGKTSTGTHLLPAVLTLGAMGATAVGLGCSTGPEKMMEFIRPAALYASVPIIAKPSNSRIIGDELQNGAVSPYDFAELMYKILNSGARVVGGCCGTAPEHIAAVRHMMTNLPLNPLPETEDVVAVCSEQEVYFLKTDMTLPDEPMDCSVSIEDDLIEIEAEGGDVALIRVAYPADVEEICSNAYMARLPIAVYAENAMLLEQMLTNYSGRLIVDKRSNVSETELETLSARYGAVLL